MLVVDEFLKINGKDDSLIESGRDRLVQALEKFTAVYGFKTNILFCSEFMSSEGYSSIFQETTERIRSSNLTEKLIETVPENKRQLSGARDYPMHELSCIQFLASRSFSLKVGPTKERQYDRIMQALNSSISFGYLLDAYALGTKTADVVVHYVPSSRGPNNGQRIFLEDDERKVRQKLEQSCDEALRYFCKIASVSGHILGLDCCEEDEINSLYGKKLKRKAIALVLDNIIKLYKEA